MCRTRGTPASRRAVAAGDSISLRLNRPVVGTLGRLVSGARGTVTLGAHGDEGRADSVKEDCGDDQQQRQGSRDSREIAPNESGRHAREADAAYQCRHRRQDRAESVGRGGGRCAGDRRRDRGGEEPDFDGHSVGAFQRVSRRSRPLLSGQ